jgi:ABC-type proline/glycine betaine transport system substrate-binding protein
MDRNATTTDTAALIKTVSKFHRKALRDGRQADVAYALGALDALRGRPADCADAWLAHHGDYLAGWCKVHGI